jgi:Glycosyltransferase (GlcNAc)
MENRLFRKVMDAFLQSMIVAWFTQFFLSQLITGVVDQIIEGEDVRCDEPIEPCDKNPDQALCKYKDQVDVFVMDAPLSVGPVFARHIGYRLYRGEYYATQSDAHVSFTTNWDMDIISQLEATHDEMAVLSTYLTDVQGSIDEKTGNSLRNTRVSTVLKCFSTSRSCVPHNAFLSFP